MITLAVTFEAFAPFPTRTRTCNPHALHTHTFFRTGPP